MSQGGSSLRALAPAKLNLGLEVQRRRPDGFHEIETIYQSLDWGDRLEFSKLPTGKGLRLERQGLSLPDGPDNSLRRAHALLERACPGAMGGTRIRLDKRIPLGAGLGGGSSDGATALLGLKRLWDLDLSPAALAGLALELGSDAPFFLLGGTAVGRGRGERLEPLPALRQGAFTLVNPGFPVSTAWAYEHLRLGLTGNPYRVSIEQVKAYLSRFPAPGMVLRNRLEDVVFPAYPVLFDIVKALEEAGAVHALMSGSGATIFGSFPDREAAGRAGALLAARWQTWVAAPGPQGILFD
ncbi:4-(cytidine 5'-diphospho)-2-C-methyl-D-erythritol kinase [bacterium]|nr:4-(cytidine 5'-diphospho)-2-C-methyl-D-erythritol kinase [bacterium]